MTLNPATLSGIQLWLRAKDLGSGSVNTWADVYDRVLTSGGGTAPTVAAASTPNGGKSVAFPASSSHFQVPSPLSVDDFPYFAGKVTSSTTYSAAYPPSLVFDGKRTTYWAASTNTGWLRIQPPPGFAAVTNYTIDNSVSEATTGSPRTWTFEGSNNGTSWTTLDTRSAITFADNTPQTFSFSNSTAYTYYRLNVTVNNGYALLLVCGIKINGIPTIDDPTTAEMWVVVKSASGNHGAPVHMTDSEDDYYPYSGAVYETFGGNRQSFTPSVAITSWRLFRAIRNATTRQWFLDGVSQLSVSPGTLSWAVTARIGAGLSTAGVILPFEGNQAEIFLRNVISTSDEVGWLIDYFNTEHGLTVAGGFAPVIGISITDTTATSSANAYPETLNTLHLSITDPTATASATAYPEAVNIVGSPLAITDTTATATATAYPESVVYPPMLLTDVTATATATAYVENLLIPSAGALLITDTRATATASASPEVVTFGSTVYLSSPDGGGVGVIGEFSGSISSTLPPPSPPIDRAKLPNPTVAPTLTSSAGGSLLAAGTYRYKYAAWRGTKAQATAPSPLATITVGVGQRVSISFPTTAGADGYLIYREDV